MQKVWRRTFRGWCQPPADTCSQEKKAAPEGLSGVLFIPICLQVVDLEREVQSPERPDLPDGPAKEMMRAVWWPAHRRLVPLFIWSQPLRYSHSGA
jgi:hypothetical protein